MFGKWLTRGSGTATAAGLHDAGAASGQPARLNETDRALAVLFLCRRDSVMPLSAADAEVVARYLLPRQFRPGEVLLREGDAKSNYMLWILEGDATIEAVTDGPLDSITMTVLQPGSTLGEMGLMDGSRRSVSCTASSAVRTAILTRQSLRALAARHPEVAVRLMSVVCMGIAVRLRDVTGKFKRYVLMNHAMRDELLGSTSRRGAMP
jgi:CRP-like cAMP-binding protein